jgi:hypothetical protein
LAVHPRWPIRAPGANELARPAGERANKLAAATAAGRTSAAGHSVGADQLAKPTGAGHVFPLTAS